MKMSYCSKRFSCAISIESRKPLVVTSAVFAPLRSMMALVARVVPCTIRPTWPGSILASFSARRMPSSTPSSGAVLVVSTLTEKRASGVSSTTSVKVPPMSTARRTASGVVAGGMVSFSNEAERRLLDPAAIGRGRAA